MTIPVPPGGSPQQWPPPSPAYAHVPVPPHGGWAPLASPLPQSMVPGPQHGEGNREQRRSLVRAFLLDRLLRLNPRGVHPAAVVLGVLCVVAWVFAVNVMLSPGVLQSFADGQEPEYDSAGDVLTWMAFAAPLAFASAGATLLILCQPGWLRIAAILVPLGTTFGTVFSVFGAASLSLTLPWLASLVALGLLGLAAVGTAMWLRRGRLWVALVGAIAVLGQWLVLALCIFTNNASSVFVQSWILYGFGISTVFVLFIICGVAEWSQRAYASAENIAWRLRIALWAPLLTAVLVLVFLGFRFTLLRDLFGESDAGFWVLPSLGQVPHAIVIAGTVVGFAVWSDRRPMRERGQGIVVAALTCAAASSLLLFGVNFLVSFVVPGGEVPWMDALGGWIDQNPHLVGILCVSALAICIVPPLWRSTAMVGAVVAIVTMLPLQASLLVSQDLPVAGVFHAVPLVVGISALLSVVNLIARRDVVDRVILFRLAVIPPLALHAGLLVPAALTDDLGRPAVVIVSALAMLLIGPKRAEGQLAASNAFLSPFVSQAGLIAVSVIGMAMVPDNDAFTTLAVIYLALPIAAVLCCDVDQPKRQARFATRDRRSRTRVPVTRTSPPVVLTR